MSALAPRDKDSVKIGIEIGGTFTDIIAVDRAGSVWTHKVSTTPDDPSRGSFQGLAESGAAIADLDTLLHGSTIATNAVLERRGATTGLLTTRGFRDVLVIQRFDKADSYDPFYERPQPLIPRSLIEEVSERVLADGTILRPLDEEMILSAVQRLIDRFGIESLAISFLHAYANGEHERRARSIVRDAFPDLYVSLSSDILPRFREYERTSTTVISAYVQPVVDRYLQRFERRLSTDGFAGSFLVMQASGGVVPSRGARSNPASMYLSGPAAGVVGAKYLSRLAQMRDLLTLDVGGTSTDISLVRNGEVTVTSEGEIGGLPIALPIVDIVTIGAGGGSIAWRDTGGMLRVGPRSAGAQPGPACYGRGGTEPTLTDALVLLGLVPPDSFLGGRMRLDTLAAETAVRPLAAEYRMSAVDMAESITQIAVANITQATRLVSVQRGHDPRRYAICAFGGAGPLLAASVADQLSIPRVVVPQNPGLFSAFGLLVSDYRRDFTRTLLQRLGVLDMGDLRRLIEELRAQAVAEFDEYGIDTRILRYQPSLDLRYDGQGFELSVDLEDRHLNAATADLVRRLFNELHLIQYGHNFPEQEIVAVNLHLSVTAPRAGDHLYRRPRTQNESRKTGRIRWLGEWRECSLVTRDGLDASPLSGPAVITEATSTTFVPPTWNAAVDPLGSIVLEKGLASS